MSCQNTFSVFMSFSNSLETFNELQPSFWVLKGVLNLSLPQLSDPEKVIKLYVNSLQFH